MIRYNLALPDALFSKLKEIADIEDTTMLEIIKKSLSLYLFIYEKKDCKLIVKTDGGDVEIKLI